ncbi:gp16 family protein [Sagittula sp. S175]|uniref:gp16 family protein n=1 Tax=Sagittula sp. S175 TaxID=3415129 RepID=UPI003C7B446B
MTASLIRTIQVGARQLGIDKETRQTIQLRLVGKASLADMTDAERQKVLDDLKARGFKPTGGAKKHKMAPSGPLRLVHVLWAALGHAGVLTDPTRNGLNKFVRSRFEKTWSFVPRDIDDLREPEQIEQVLSALKSWVRRDCPDFDWGRIGR